MKFTAKRTATVVASFAVAVAASGIAYAYWSTTGSGSGSAAAANPSGTVTLHASFPAAALAPGAPQTVSYTADNGNTYSTVVGALTVGTISVDATHATAGCSAADFSATAVTTNTRVLAGANGTAVGSGTITMADTAADQSACKGATITIPVTSV